MTQMVTIEGSVTPSADLPRGERRTVVYTDRIKRLVDRGFIVIVGEPQDVPETELTPIPEVAQAPPPPGPHTAESTGTPNVGTEFPADGQFHELVSEPAPPVPQHPNETAQPAAPAAEGALHDNG